MSWMVYSEVMKITQDSQLSQQEDTSVNKNCIFLKIVFIAEWLSFIILQQSMFINGEVASADIYLSS